MRKDEIIKKLKKCPRNAVIRAHHILAETSDEKASGWRESEKIL